MRVTSALRALALVALLAGCLAAVPSAGAAVILPPGSITVPSSGSFLYFNSQAGDYIGGGVEQLYTSADTNFSASLQPGGGYFHAAVIQGPYTHWWYVDLAAPPGESLQTGSYTNAERAPFRSAGHPGIDISGDGRGCNTDTGQFDVNDLQFAPTGELLVFDATFEQHCEGGTAALFGRIRIENPPPPPDVTPPNLYLPGDMTIEAPDSSGTNVSFSASASDNSDPNPVVSCAPASGSFFPVGTTTVNCQASDASGNVASGSFQIHVLPPLQLTIIADSRGTASAKTGLVTISGTMSCSRPIGIDLSGTVSQLFANRVSISGSFYTHVNCAAPSVRWSATVTGTNGRLSPGQANLSDNWFGCELSCHSGSSSTSVGLIGAK